MTAQQENDRVTFIQWTDSTISATPASKAWSRIKELAEFQTPSFLLFYLNHNLALNRFPVSL
jgi:hypothetical protein